MRKAKQYDWKDSNLALFGSDTEKQVKKDSAETEPAWKEVTDGKLGLRIWRIEKFKVVPWPKEEYGKFYQGDSYIILNSYKTEGQDDIKYDVHFWIGKESTQDEYGTAAYKTVELDTFLDDKPIQHREVQGYESKRFRQYFNNKMEYMLGGVDSGFRHVKTQEYEPRLFHFHGDKKGVTVNQIGMTKQNVDDSDIYILDSGSRIIQYNGHACNKDEKFKAAQYVNALKSERSGRAQIEVIDEASKDRHAGHEFFKSLSDDPRDEEDNPNIDTDEKVLMKLSDNSGKLEFTKVANGELLISMIDDDDVFIVDIGSEIFVYIGYGCSDQEKKNAMSYAHQYLMKTTHPLIPVTCVKNRESKDFMACFSK